MKIPTLDKPTIAESAFAKTRWTLVLESGGDGEQAWEALNRLCTTYWAPLYSFLRRKGHAKADAEDLIQGYFASLLRRETFSRARQEKGRLRSFLLKDLKFFLSNEHARAHADRRGGYRTIVSIDQEQAERGLEIVDGGDVDPETHFDREWAARLVGHVLEQLAADYRKRGQEENFERLKPFITPGSDPETYEEVAGTMELTVPRLKGRIHRLRLRFRELLEAKIAETVATRDEIVEEMQYLRSLFAR